MKDIVFPAATIVFLILVALFLFLEITLPPATLTLSAGQSEGNTVFVGVLSDKLWFAKENGGFSSSYLTFSIPERVGARVSMDGAAYTVISVDSNTDTIHLKLP